MCKTERLVGKNYIFFDKKWKGLGKVAGGVADNRIWHPPAANWCTFDKKNLKSAGIDMKSKIVDSIAVSLFTNSETAAVTP